MTQARAAAAREGEGRTGPAWLRAWMARHAGELERHLERMLGGLDEARDVLQEVWLAAAEDPPARDPASDVRAWLYRVATNAALDRLATRRRRSRLLAARRERVVPESAPPPDAWLDGLGPDGRRRVRSAVAALPTKQREAVWWRWAEGRDYQEIAWRHGGTAAAARANVYQALKRLRRELEELWAEER